MATYWARAGLTCCAAAIALIATDTLPHRSSACGEPDHDAHSVGESADVLNGLSDASGHGSGHHDSAVTGDHSHGTLVIPEGQPIPAVTLTVHEDAMRGWNLELDVQNFSLAPEQVNQQSSPNVGHAHLYVNGDKLTRLYGLWYYLESLPSGPQELRVELNANGHEVLIHDGEPIADTVIIDVP